jgi:hypothetical protein
MSMFEQIQYNELKKLIEKISLSQVQLEVKVNKVISNQEVKSSGI